MPPPHNRPNILFIMSDQHRYDYLGAAGADFLRTPNLDRLAAAGVRFSHCCTNSPVCAPARIGLAAGQQPSRLGALGNNAYLPQSVTTYYQRLRDDGYRVGCVGKLDLAKPDGYNGRHGDRPCVYGWGFTHPEECEGKMHAGAAKPIGPYTHYLAERGLLQAFHEDYVLRRQQGWNLYAAHDSVLPTEAFEDAYIGRRAAEWIDQVPDDFPWHYFVSFVGPHDPFDPPTEYADKYRGKPMPAPIPGPAEDKPDWVRRRAYDDPDPEQVAVARRQYCASTELIDDQIGLMLAALERRGMLDNTIIVYTSDHGEMLGDHGQYAKSVPYESALRVPLIVSGPGIAGGRVSDALVELIDANPTVCELAGLPPQENIDARSFAGILRGSESAHREDVVSRLQSFTLIRTERYKYVQHLAGHRELYDLAEDPTEQRNVIQDHPEVAGQLSRRMGQRFLEGQWRR